MFEDGVCDVCCSVSVKYVEIDWDVCEREFCEIFDCYCGDGMNYDCIILVSGGKDSCY